MIKTGENLNTSAESQLICTGNFIWVFQLFRICFTPEWLKMAHNGKFCPKSGLDWLKTANFGHFACFSILSFKMRLRLTQNGQFHPIQNFSHLLPPKYVIFWEISKIFILGSGGGATFSNHFILKQLKMTHNGKFCQEKWLRLAQNGQFWLNFDKNLNISAESWPNLTIPSEQGLFFQAGRNESKECYAMIKTVKILNISVESRPICTESSE